VLSMGTATVGRVDPVSFDYSLYALRWINLLEHHPVLMFNEAYLYSHRTIVTVQKASREKPVKIQLDSYSLSYE
jgi:hypothetical protein